MKIFTRSNIKTVLSRRISFILLICVFIMANNLGAAAAYADIGGIEDGGPADVLMAEESGPAGIPAAEDGEPADVPAAEDSEPADVPGEKSVYVVFQDEKPAAGAAGTASFIVFTSGVGNGGYPVELYGAPAGVAAQNISIYENTGILRLKTAAETPHGRHAVRVAIDGAVSAEFILEIINIPVITAVSSGLENLQIGKIAAARIDYTLSSGTYAEYGELSGRDFEAQNLPEGLMQEIRRVTDNIVSSVITGYPVKTSSAAALIVPAHIPKANVAGAETDVVVVTAGAITAGPVTKGDGAAVSGAPEASWTSGGVTGVYVITAQAVFNANPMTAQTVEYAIAALDTLSAGELNALAWQEGVSFTGNFGGGLSYYVYARTKENADYRAGEAKCSRPFKIGNPKTVNTGGTATVTYAGTAINLQSVSSLFTVDPNAGERVYVIEAGGDGVGIIVSNRLEVTRAGKFIISLSTSAKTGYDAADIVTGELTVNPAPLSGTVSIESYGTGPGDVLTAILTFIAPAGAEYEIRWLRSGSSISGATGSTYKLTSADEGKIIVLEISGAGAYSGKLSDSISIPGSGVNPPSGLTANAGDRQVSLSWSSPSNAGSVTRYEVTRSGMSSWINVGTSTQYTFPGLSNGTAYTFKVRAYVNGAYSSEAYVSAIPRSSVEISAPTGFTAIAGDKLVALTWGAPSVTGGVSIVRYEMTRSGVSNWVNVGLTTKYTYTGLTNGTTYTFKVRAYAGGVYGAESAVTCAPAAASAANKTESPFFSAADAGTDSTGTPAGTLTYADLADYNIPAGSSASVVLGNNTVKEADGTVTVVSGGNFIITSGVSFTVPYGTIITPDGVIALPEGGLGIAVTWPNGLIFNIPEDAVVVLNDSEPRGYSVVCGNRFSDVNEGDWFYGDVIFAYSHGLMLGTGLTPPVFSPYVPTTRGMLVTILYRMNGSPDVGHVENRFPDAAEDQWYYDAVKWAASNGVVLGDDDGLFNPDEEISRQDMAVILMRYADFTGLTLPAGRDYAEFDDGPDVAGYAIGAVERAFSAEIIYGESTGYFHPYKKAARAETSAMLNRFCHAAE